VRLARARGLLLGAWWAAGGAVLGAGGACADGQDEGLAGVRLALSAEACLAYCADIIQARLFRVGEPFPLGPARVVPCGEDVVFEALPAGHQVRVEVDVIAPDGAVLLRGESAATTIVADGLVDLSVALWPVASPVITAVGPDPLVRGEEGGALVISGEGFGSEPEGDAGALLGADELAIAAWSPESVVATVDGDAGGLGDGVVVRRCGVGSEPAALRVVAREGPGAAAMAQAPGCAGRRFVGLAREGDAAAIVAARCDDAAQGYVQRVRGDDASCPLVPGEAWSLGDSPAGLAVAGGRAWILLEGVSAIARVDLGAGAALPTVALPEGVRGVRVAAAPGAAFVIGETLESGALTLLEVTEGGAAPVSGVEAGLELRELASGGDRLYLTGVAAGPLGKLIAVPFGGGPVTSWSLPGCDQPRAVAAVADGWLLVACDDPGLLAFAPDSGELRHLPLAPGIRLDSLAPDALGDVALALDAGASAARLFQRSEDALLELVAWTVGDAPAGPLIRLGAGHDFLVVTGGGGGLGVWTPYREAGPCPAPAP